MTLPGLMTPTVLYAAAALLGAFVIVYYTLRVRRAKAAALPVVDENATLIAQIDERLSTVATRIEAHQADLIDRVHDDIRSLQSDMDWLAGERMIEEAIAMAHAGQSASHISSELGLSVEDAETISRFRKH